MSFLSKAKDLADQIRKSVSIPQTGVSSYAAPQSPAQQLGQLVPSALTFGKQAATSFAQPVQQFGQGIGAALNAPANYMYAQKNAQIDQKMADLYNFKAQNALKAKNIDASRNFSNIAVQQGQSAANRYATLGQGLQQGRSNVIAGGFNTGLTLLGAGEAPIANMAISTGIGALTSGLQGNSISQGAAEGLGGSFKNAGINKILSPYTTTLAEGLLPASAGLPARIAARQIGAGLGNVGENFLSTKLTTGKNPTLGEGAFNFLMGAAGEALTQATSVQNGHLPAAQNNLFEITKGNKLQLKPQARDQLGQYTKQAEQFVDKYNTKIKVLGEDGKSKFVKWGEWYNDPITIRNVDGTTRTVKRGEAGFVDPSAIVDSIKGKSEPVPTETPPSPLQDAVGNQATDTGVGAFKPPVTPDVVPTEQGINEANTSSNMNGGKGLSSFTDDLKNSFQDWVNSRRASKVQGTVASQQFQNLDAKGINGIFEVQAGSTSKEYAPLRSFFDDLHSKLVSSGVDVNYQKDYLPQLWADSPDKVQAVLGKSLSTKPGFTMDKLIEDYKTGIDAGLTPKFNKISDLTGWYAQRANKAIADKTFFNGLLKENYILPASKAPQDWVTINPDSFPKYQVNTGEGTYQGSYKAPANLADTINNYLSTPNGVLSQIADKVARAKNITLSFGLPNPIAGAIEKAKGGSFAEGSGTAINAHGFNILARHTLFGSEGNPISRLLTGAKYMVNPESAANMLTKELDTAPAAVKNGLTLSTEDHSALLNESETVAKSLGKKWNQVFEQPLFNKMIPALKLSSYNELVKNGMEGKDAATMINNVYGGINYDQLGRSKETQNLLRSIILAPDWAESNLKLGGNLAKSLVTKGKVAGQYRTMAATLAGGVVTANIINKLTSGHYMYENDPGHTFEIQTGYTGDGQKRYVRPFGTAADFVRLPFDIASGLAKGDPSTVFRTVSNRLSIPLSSAMHLLTNTDYLGNNIYGTDKYGKQIPPLQAAGGIGSEALGFVGFPSAAKNAIDVATGKQGLEQGALQALELPVRYTGGRISGTDKNIATSMGLKGKDQYDLGQKLRGQAPFSPEQQAKIAKGGQPMLDAMIGARAQDKTKSTIVNFMKDNNYDALKKQYPNEANYYAAEKIYSDVNAIPKQDREARQQVLQEYIDRGYTAPEITKIITQIKLLDRQGMSKSDRELALIKDPGVIAIKIIDRLDGVKDKRRKRELVTLYQRYGILTPEVQQAIIKFKQ